MLLLFLCYCALGKDGAVSRKVLDIRLAQPLEIYYVYDTSKWIRERSAKFISREEINLSDSARYYLIYIATDSTEFVSCEIHTNTSNEMM